MSRYGSCALVWVAILFGASVLGCGSNGGQSCADIFGTCDPNASCDESSGTPQCVCDQGWTGDGLTCTDVDECAEMICLPEATCLNTQGSFGCACPEGYEGNGIDACDDIDECADGSDNCSDEATCMNTPGSFECDCDLGFAQDGPSDCRPLIFAADGKAAVDGNLYLIDPVTEEITTVGPIGYSLTGLAMSPGGVLYGSESTQSGTQGNARLVTVDQETGAGTVVGELYDAGTDVNHNSVPDLTFRFDVLYGWTEFGDDLITVDPATAAVSVVGDSGVSSAGSGTAADVAGTIWFFPGRVTGSLYTIDPVTGVGFEGPMLSGGTYDNINSAVWMDGTLYAVETVDAGSATSPAQLVTVDQGTGVITPLFAIPTGISAIATYRH